MSKFLTFFAAAVAVVGFSVSTVMAHGGGGGHGGGGHHGGAHHSSHHTSHHSNHHASHHHNGHHSHYHHSHWANHNRPFSHGWYGRHGGNWGYGWGGWGWGNPWGVATLGGAAAWLGADGLYNNWGNYGYGEPADVLTADNADDSDADDAGTDEDGDDEAEDNNEQVAKKNAEEPQQEPAAQAAEAAALARNGQTDPPKQTAFLPLGVFTLAPEGQREANALVQLALSKDGTLRGTYYDLLSDRDQQIRGSVDKQTGRAAFTFGQQGKITFETTLGNLTRENGTVGVHYENGKKSTWTLARYEKEPTDEAKEGTEVQTGAKNPTGEKPVEIPVEVEPDTDPAAPAQR